MHISIIHDVKTIFAELGHGIESINLSNHTWVNNEHQGNIKGVNQKNFKDINQKFCNKFYRRHEHNLKKCDQFIHSYPPAFALLFDKFEKRVITIACTRFDFPTYPKNHDWLINGLNRMAKAGQLIPVANNLLDKKYCDDNFDFEWRHITSLCNYMEKKQNNGNGKYILWSRSDYLPSDNLIDINFTIKKKKYDRNEIKNYSGVIHLPYNLSIMSAFEHYYQDIPLFFPTQSFQKYLFENRKDMLTEVLFPESSLKFDATYIKYADWYDEENMKHLSYFDSFEDLSDKLRHANLEQLRLNMLNHNILRKELVYEKWDNLIKEIK